MSVPTVLIIGTGRAAFQLGSALKRGKTKLAGIMAATSQKRARWRSACAAMPSCCTIRCHRVIWS
jgi:hypothetical protein